MEFFDYYTFYEGRDSVGSNGFNVYVSQQRALELRIINATMEQDVMDVFEDSDNKINDFHRQDLKSSLNSSWSPSSNETVASMKNSTSETTSPEKEDDKEQKKPSEPHPKRNIKDEPFLYMSSASSPEPWGPRQSIRLEGKRRFHRGLFILDLRHMPTGCGVWPAFWLTDEANWPVNGEIDIVEGVNYQSVAKTALHTTQTCLMDDIPMGVKTGSWDEAIGIPNKKTGIPDMTLRYATDCFVYNPHQWLNQGCVAVDLEGGTLGMPLNEKGGGVFVLEWDPVFGHIRSWVFSPHSKVPLNLRQAIRTASEPNPLHQVAPDPNLWPLPYGYFAIGT
jgi:Glycosyl hydrolases family 16